MFETVLEQLLHLLYLVVFGFLGVKCCFLVVYGAFFCSVVLFNK